MLIALLSDPIEVADYKELFPNTSFPPSGPDKTWLLDNNCRPINVWKEHSNTQKLVPSDPYIEGDWVYTVQVVDKTQEELLADKLAKSSEIRTQRNKLLSDTDWTQLADSPVDKPIWATYRQALRDITLQTGFPFTVDFPVAP